MRIVLESRPIVVYHKDSMHESPSYIEEKGVSVHTVFQGDTVRNIPMV
jgi:hypothetical protein